MIVLFLVFLSHFQVDFHNGHINLHSHQQCRRVPFCSTFLPLFTCDCFDDSHSDRCEVILHCGIDWHPLWSMMLSIFSYACWPSVFLLLKKLYSGLLPIFLVELFVSFLFLFLFSILSCMGCLYILYAVAAAAKSPQSCPTLCGPADGSPPGSAVPGIPRQENWSGLPFPSAVHESEKWSRSVVSDS